MIEIIFLTFQRLWILYYTNNYFKFAVILAGSIPLLGLFISLFGAFCLSALGIAFPAIMEICVNYSDNLTKWCLIKNLLLIIFGVVGLLAGSYSALSEIIVKLGEPPILRNETTTLAPM